MLTNQLYFECAAYPVSVACGEAKHKRLKCAESSYTKCCKPLVKYISSARQQITNMCANAPEKPTECPFP